VNPTRTGVVLFNLGGPDSIAAVEPFLINLFNDPAIVRLPQPLRYAVARLIARRRRATAQAIYGHLGGRSPILEETLRQAAALETVLAGQASERTFKVVVAMRYWMPRSDEAAAALADWGAQEIVLLPLYPQFSTTSTLSSLRDWEHAAKSWRVTALARATCCWPMEPGLIQSIVAKLAPLLTDDPRLRVLFSAHGLPEAIVRAGDPYPVQVGETVAAVMQGLAEQGIASVDRQICYQSRVGPLKWITPSTDAEVRRAGAEGKGIIVVPISFVSEHSETLVELDRDYRRLAEDCGVPRYERVSTPGTDPAFIGGLARLVSEALTRPARIASGAGRKLCADSPGCPLANRG
jgi:protoporphyrin/coproporphyrin ferrochelatase